MNKRIYLIPMFLIFNSIICSCDLIEPTEEEPNLMEMLVGKYRSDFYVLEGDSIIGNLNTEETTYQLSLKSNYTFTLNIEGTLPHIDSTIVIEQQGTFNKINVTYDANVNCPWAVCNPFYEGRIRFYPQNEKRWDGNFHCSKSSSMITDKTRFVTMDGVEFTLYRWKKIN